MLPGWCVVYLVLTDFLHCISCTEGLGISTEDLFDCWIYSLVFYGEDFASLMSRNSKSQSVRGHDVLLSLAVTYD